MRHLVLALAAAAGLGIGGASAALVDPGAFTPAGEIGFGPRSAVGTVNPSYTLGGVTVSFGGSFQGQTLAGTIPETFASTAPTGPLVLQGRAKIFRDRAASDKVVLGGVPDFFAPIAILFDQPVPAVALTIGFFDVVGGVTLQAFDAAGTSLGSVTNSLTGFETFRLADDGGVRIAGISVFNNSDREPGFGIDTVSFAAAAPVAVPAPASLALLLTAIPGLALATRRRRR